MKLTKLSTLTLTCILSTTLLTACGNKQETTTDAEPTKTEVPSTEGASSQATAMTKITLDNIPAIVAIYKFQEGITDEQKACLDKIDLADSASELTTMFSDNFSNEELSEALALFNDPEVKKGTAYTMQMIQEASGAEIKEPLAPPSQETIQKLQDFGASELGQKIQGFTGADDLMQKQMGMQVKECGVDVAM